MHIRIREGLVQAIKTTRNGYTEVLVDIGLSTEKAINYDELTGPIHPGDRVILNTTAVHKGLGTGGIDVYKRQDIVRELARMLGGEDSEIAKEHAKQLLNQHKKEEYM